MASGFVSGKELRELRIGQGISRRMLARWMKRSEGRVAQIEAKVSVGDASVVRYRCAIQAILESHATIAKIRKSGATFVGGKALNE